MHDRGSDQVVTAAPEAQPVPRLLTLGSGESAFSFARSAVPAHATARNTTRHDGEILIVISGVAELVIGASARSVSKGDVLAVTGRLDYTVSTGGEPLEVALVRWASRATPGAKTTSSSSSWQAFNRDTMDWAYDMHLGHLFDARQIPDLPFGSSFGSVPPRSVSKFHRHQDGELLLILDGEAGIWLGDEITQAVAGEFVVIPPFLRHAVQNEKDIPVDLISIYWDDIPEAAMRLSDIDIRDELPERTAIFCPPPTPNGGLHIGHIAGPYVRADMFARALRTVGKKADLVAGTDDHQSYVAVAASAEGIQPRQLALREGDRLAATLKAIGFDAALFYRPSLDQDHEARMRSLLDAVVSSPAVSRGEVETPWCPACEIPLYQAFAGGYCPSCAAACDGEICEECGHPNSAGELRGLVCRVCGGMPQMRKESAFLLDLRYLSEQVKQYLHGTTGGGGSRLLGARLLAGGLDHYRISRRSQWGIALSATGSADGTHEVIDPWVELALTQLDNMRRLGVTGLSAVSFFGFDNSFYYAILLPALGIAASQGDLLPYGSVVNYFLHLDGAKISTSRNHAIWADELLDKVPADIVRLALLRQAPEEAPADCKAANFDNLDGDPLIASIQKWLTELPAGPVPGTGAWTIAHREFYRRLGSSTKSLDALLIPETFSARDYISQLEAFVSSALTFRAAEERKRLLPGMSEEARTSVALEYLSTKSLAAFLYPVMPELGGRIWAALGLKGTPIRERLWTFLPVGTIMRPVLADGQ